MYDQPLTIIDVETTGGSPYFSRIIEIGIIRVEHGEVMREYKTFLNPEVPIPEFITEMTGIGDQDVAEAPLFADVADDILELFEDAVFVAHNVEFDYSFLREEFRRIGYQFTLDRLCTVRLSRVLFPEHKRHNLTAIIERFEFVCENRHRAFDDAKILWDFLQMLPAKFETDRISTAMKRTLQRIPPAQQRKMPVVEEPEVTYVPEEQSLEL
jgi:DNA polymerase III subunit epsilon